MANLLSTNITGIIAEKTGTTPSPSTTDRSNDLLNGSPTGSTFGTPEDSPPEPHDNKPQQMQFDPHNANKFVVVWDVEGSYDLYARMGTIVDKTVTWAAQGPVLIATGGEGHWGPQIAFDPSVPNKFIVHYQEMSGSKSAIKVGTISNLTMSFGARSESDRLYGGSVQFDPNTPGRFCINGIEYNDYKERIRCGDVATNGTGTTISGYGADFTFTANQTTNSGIPTYSRFAYDPNTAGRLVAIWSDRSNLEGNNPYVGYARTLDVATNKTITATSSTTKWELDDYNEKHHSIAWDPHNATKFIISWTRSNNGVGYARVGTITNATGALSFGAKSQFATDTERSFIAFDPGIPGKFAIAWNGGTGSSRTGRVILGTYSGGTTITSWGTVCDFNTTQTNAAISCCIDFDPKRPGKFLIQSVEGVLPGGGTPRQGRVRAGNINENTLSLNVSTGERFILDMSNVAGTIGTFTITGAASGSDKMTSFILKIIQSAGPKQFDWGGKITNVKWPVGTKSVYDEGDFSGTIPYMSKTDNSVNILKFITYDEGTTWYGIKEGLDIK